MVNFKFIFGESPSVLFLSFVFLFLISIKSTSVKNLVHFLVTVETTISGKIIPAKYNLVLEENIERRRR